MGHNSRQWTLGGGQKTGSRRVRRGVDIALRALVDAGRIGQADQAHVALLRALADDMDDERTSPDPSRYVIGSLAGRIRDLMADVRGEDMTSSDAFSDLVTAMQSRAAPVVDAETADQADGRP